MVSKKILFSAVGKVAARYGDKWARMAGDKTVSHLTRLARDRGLSDRVYDLDSLTSELKDMYRQGRFNRQEWSEIRKKLRQAWAERKRTDKS